MRAAVDVGRQLLDAVERALDDPATAERLAEVVGGFSALLDGLRRAVPGSGRGTTTTLRRGRAHRGVVTRRIGIDVGRNEVPGRAARRRRHDPRRGAAADAQGDRRAGLPPLRALRRARAGRLARRRRARPGHPAGHAPRRAAHHQGGGPAAAGPAGRTARPRRVHRQRRHLRAAGRVAPSATPRARGTPCSSPWAPASAAACWPAASSSAGPTASSARWVTWSSTPTGPDCPCGRRGCWERYASGSALAHFGRVAAEAGRLPAAVGAGRRRPRPGHAGSTSPRRRVPATRPRWPSSTGSGAGSASGWSTSPTCSTPSCSSSAAASSELRDLIVEPIRHWLGQLLYAPSFRPHPRLEIARLGQRAGAVGAAHAARGQCGPDGRANSTVRS